MLNTYYNIVIPDNNGYNNLSLLIPVIPTSGAWGYSSRFKSLKKELDSEFKGLLEMVSLEC